MNVLIIGAGDMGRGIATRLANSNANLIIHDVDATKAEALASELRVLAAGSRVQVTATPTAAVATSDIVILASWYAVNLETARTMVASSGSAAPSSIVTAILLRMACLRAGGWYEARLEGATNRCGS